MQTIDDINLYYIYNIPTRKSILKTAKEVSGQIGIEYPVGCGGNFLVHCGCIGPDCVGPLVIKETLSDGNAHIYNDFNCFSENILTGETTLLLNSVKQNIESFKNLTFKYMYPIGPPAFYPPIISGDWVLLSYIFGDYELFSGFKKSGSYILLLNIEDPTIYKFYEIPISSMAPPAMSENYIVVGDTIYEFQDGEVNPIGKFLQNKRNGLTMLNVPIIYSDINYSTYSISGSNLVFTEFTKQSNELTESWKVYDIYLYNIKELKRVKIYSNTIDSTSEHPVIWGDKVVWMQSKRIGKSESGSNLATTSIMLYNLTTGELREIIPEKPNPLWPTTNGRYIAWLDTEVGDEEKGRAPDVYLYDIETGETWRVSPDD